MITGNVGRWSLALATIVAAFFAVWAVCHAVVPGLDLDVELSLAGLTAAVLSLPLGVWASGPGGVSQQGRFVIGEIPREPPAFQPRDDLRRRLTRAGRITVVTALTGARGVGKTQLAAAVARTCITRRWPVVAWVVAEDETQLISGLGRLGRALGLCAPMDDDETAAGKARSWLESTAPRRCLLVFDNAVEADLLTRWLPAAGHARIVITTTQRSFEELGSTVDVEAFTEQQALRYLQERLGPQEETGARAVAREVGHLPLALAQAAATMRTRSLSYPELLARLQVQSIENALTRRPGDGYRLGAARAVLLALTSLPDPDGRVAELAGLIAVLSPVGVSRTVLHGFGDETDSAVAVLAESSLVAFNVNDRSIIMHRFTRRVLQDRDERSGELAERVGQAAALLTAFRDRIVERSRPWDEHRAQSREAVLQINALWDTASGRLNSDEVRPLLRLRGWMIGQLWMVGEHTQAINLGRTVLEDHERLLGADDEDTIDAAAGLALAYGGQRRHDEAIALNTKVVTWREEHLGDTHPETLNARNILANNYLESSNDYGLPDRASTAVALHEHNLGEYLRVLGETHRGTPYSWRSLCMAYAAAGRRS
ncbi:hypothetical protein DMB66_45180 [Actinoplanes sp. ATCC 53533]|nr:hypothetical protein DMB66_45180 [Actinoplanes sp. ATCC 53533]